MSANMLNYGLPVEVNNLFRLYKPGEVRERPPDSKEQPNNATTQSHPGSATLIVSLLFVAIFVIVVLGLAYKFSQKRRASRGS